MTKKAEETTDKKKQAFSVSYNVRAFGQNISKYRENGLINDEEHEQLKAIHKKMVERWIGLETGV